MALALLESETTPSPIPEAPMSTDRSDHAPDSTCDCDVPASVTWFIVDLIAERDDGWRSGYSITDTSGDAEA